MIGGQLPQPNYQLAGGGGGGTTYSRRVIQLVVDTTGIERDVRVASSSLQSLERSVNQIKSALAGMLAIGGVNQLKEFADAQTRIRTQLQAVLPSMQAVNEAQARLLEISSQTRSSLDATTGLFTKLRLSTDQAKVSNEQLYRVVTTVNSSLVLGGASAGEAASTMLQLSQAFASGRLQGDEFRAVLENAPYLVRILTEELHTNVGGLREMSKEGKLTGDIMLQVFSKRSDEIAAALAKMPMTLDQSLQILSDRFSNFVGVTDRTYHITQTLAQGILYLSQNVDKLGAVFTIMASATIGRLVLPMIVELVTAIGGATTFMGALSATTSGVLTILGGWPVVLGAVIGAIVYYVSTIKSASAATAELIDSTQVFTEQQGNTALKKISDSIKDQEKNVRNLSTDLTEASQTYDTATVDAARNFSVRESRKGLDDDTISRIGVGVVDSGQPGFGVTPEQAAERVQALQDELTAAQDDLTVQQELELATQQRTDRFREQREEVDKLGGSFKELSASALLGGNAIDKIFGDLDTDISYAQQRVAALGRGMAAYKEVRRAEDAQTLYEQELNKTGKKQQDLSPEDDAKLRAKIEYLQTLRDKEDKAKTAAEQRASAVKKAEHFTGLDKLQQDVKLSQEQVDAAVRGKEALQDFTEQKERENRIDQLRNEAKSKGLKFGQAEIDQINANSKQLAENTKQVERLRAEQDLLQDIKFPDEGLRKAHELTRNLDLTRTLLKPEDVRLLEQYISDLQNGLPAGTQAAADAMQGFLDDVDKRLDEINKKRAEAFSPGAGGGTAGPQFQANVLAQMGGAITPNNVQQVKDYIAAAREGTEQTFTFTDAMKSLHDAAATQIHAEQFGDMAPTEEELRRLQVQFTLFSDRLPADQVKALVDRIHDLQDSLQTGLPAGTETAANRMEKFLVDVGNRLDEVNKKRVQAFTTYTQDRPSMGYPGFTVETRNLEDAQTRASRSGSLITPDDLDRVQRYINSVKEGTDKTIDFTAAMQDLHDAARQEIQNKKFGSLAPTEDELRRLQVEFTLFGDKLPADQVAALTDRIADLKSQVSDLGIVAAKLQDMGNPYAGLIKGVHEFQMAWDEAMKANANPVEVINKTGQAALTTLQFVTQQMDAMGVQSFAIRKGIAAAEAAINAALAITNILAHVPPPASFALAGVVAGLAGAQLATIMAQDESGGANAASTVKRRAFGGSVSPRELYQVGERGPEVLQTGGKQYMIPQQGGQITPLHGGARQIRVINNGPPIEATGGRELPDGTIEIIVDRAVSRSVAASESNFARQLNTGYGKYAEALNTHTNARRTL